MDEAIKQQSTSLPPISDKPFGDPFLDLLFIAGCEFIFNPKTSEAAELLEDENQ